MDQLGRNGADLTTTQIFPHVVRSLKGDAKRYAPA